jgi:hypothetical protein
MRPERLGYVVEAMTPFHDFPLHDNHIAVDSAGRLWAGILGEARVSAEVARMRHRSGDVAMGSGRYR